MAAALNMPTSFVNRGLAVVYAATIFVSAFLLFQIQPMISKAILPWFGGTPAVWTICLLFFQSILFAGYAYAHCTNAWLSPGKQAAVHVGLLILSLALLHVLPDASMQPPGDADPTRAILIILILTIGLPYFVLSATGPLLQAWYSRSFSGRTPYRLYALSNIGSLLALLGYPFIFERQLDLRHQAMFWSAGFILFAFLCAYAAWRMKAGKQSSTAAPEEIEAVEGVIVPAEDGDPNPPTAGRYLSWLLLPAFASIVLMATTNHISTDVAVVPLLWVVPLALYLLTFIIAFDRPNWYFPLITSVATLIVLYPTCAINKNNNVGWLRLYECGITGRCVHMLVDGAHRIFGGTSDSVAKGPGVFVNFLGTLTINFATMFGICMLCHGKLAKLRPPARYLTSYYLMISAGGALGGIAVSLVAPHVFKSIVEWNLSVFAAAVGAVAIILSALVNRAVDPDLKWNSESVREFALSDSSTSTSLVTSSSSKFWPRLLLAAILVPISFLMLDLVEFLFSSHKDAVYRSRNFFGALTIRELNADKPLTRELVLLNGTTIHGTQFTSPERRTQPTSYYATDSGVGLVLQYFHEYRPPGGVRIGDVGLGAGTLAAYAQKFDHITFYEINPTVLDISTSGKWFTFVTDARNRGAFCDIKLGDARLTLQRELQGDKSPTSEKGVQYHVLVLDAFSGDAVPTHLLTAEAMDIYKPYLATQSKMGIDGALLIHVSNRYLDLERIARGDAEYLKFNCVVVKNEGDDSRSINSSDWVVLTRNKALLEYLMPYVDAPGARKPAVLWTDAHSSLFEILHKRKS